MIEYSVIGLIVDKEPVLDKDFSEVKKATFKAGWHVNTTESTEKTKPFEIEVKTPIRVYSGAETIFLRFNDEAEWEYFLEHYDEKDECECINDEWCDRESHGQ